MTLRVKPGNGPSGGPGGMRTSLLSGGCTTTLPLRGRQTSGLWSQDQAMLERYFRLWQEQKTYGRALTIESSPLVSVAANWDAPAATAPSITQPEPVGTLGPDLADLPGLILRLMSALSLNKSQSARVFKVTRPTLYEWLEGKAPNATNGARIETLARWVERAGVSAARPLPLRFVRQPVVEGRSALLDALEADPLDEALVNELLRVARALTDQAEARSAEREASLTRTRGKSSWPRTSRCATGRSAELGATRAREQPPSSRSTHAEKRQRVRQESLGRVDVHEV